jgi:hypothetical protein
MLLHIAFGVTGWERRAMRVHVVDKVARFENIRREKGRTSSRKLTSDRRKKLTVFSRT